MVLSPADMPMEVAAAPVAAARADSFWRRLLAHRLALAGMVILGLLLAVALGARGISTLDERAQLPLGLSQMGVPHAPVWSLSPVPDHRFRLGADHLGRDVWTRTLHGARISLLVAVCAMFTSVLIGTSIGLLGGYFGGWIDVVLMRFTEMIMSLPTILLAITLFMVLPGEDPTARLVKLLLAIGLVTWTGIARGVRGLVLSLKEQEFIEAARAVGCSDLRIVAMHLLPNVLPTVIVLATLATGHNMLLEAGLSYLGLGADPSQPSWGRMIADAQPYILSAPWMLIAPGVAVVFAIAGVNLLGQGLQEVLEPRQ